ncbi:MAG: hypothetical protein FWD57_06890, partial [Polyangiaceae bacterium]|nr:hypothetical protein [Polyangiaceae bacterium]
MMRINCLRCGVLVGFLAYAVLGFGCAQDDTSDGPADPGGGGGEGGNDSGGDDGELDGGSGGNAAGGSGGGGTGGSGGISIPEGPDAVIEPGATNRFLLTGTVVTPDTYYEGQVLVEANKLTCVKPGNECEGRPGANGATIIHTKGIIAPGLIDTHNHILFDIFEDRHWVPVIQSACSKDDDCRTTSKYCTGTGESAKCKCVDNVCKYTNHNHWTGEDEYGVMLDYKQCLENASQGKPVWCPTEKFNSSSRYNCEMDKWGELKGLIAGTTSIVGLPGTSGACFSSLARSIDVAQNGLDGDKIQTSVSVPAASAANGVCTNFTNGKTDAYL